MTLRASLEKVENEFCLEDEAIVWQKGMRGMVFVRDAEAGFIVLIGGLDRKSDIVLYFPLMCLISKECWLNHEANLISCGVTILLFRRLISIPLDFAKSILTRKWCPIR